MALVIVAAVIALRGAGGTPGGEATVPCSGTEMTRFHIHAHLEIDIRGVRQVIPANVGIRSTCLFWLHTHDDSGLIHVEADLLPTKYMLGQFFAVWGEPLSRDAVLGERTRPGEEVRVLVSGEPYVGGTARAARADRRAARAAIPGTAAVRLSARVQVASRGCLRAARRDSSSARAPS